MPHMRESLATTVPRDLTAAAVVFLVALPLCLGVPLAANAPPFAGLLAGIIGGILVGVLSGSHTSVSGASAGLTAVVGAQIASLGSFEAFLLALCVAGLVQLALGAIRAGFISAFFPTSVITGLLAAIGVILILKQIPHVLGHDPDPEGEMAFLQPDHENTFTELLRLVGDIHPGAATIGLISLGLLAIWEYSATLKRSVVPASLVVIVVGVALSLVFQRMGRPWAIGINHLVKVPVADSVGGFIKFFRTPDFSQWRNPAVYTGGFTIALVASLETLLNLEAVDKIDPRQRTSPSSRELLAQGAGNLVGGLIGAIPVSSVIIRSSVNINAGARTKLSAIAHGVLLLVSVALLPAWLNKIPVACLAAILLVTGIKLASPAVVRSMWKRGMNQFAPFAITVAAIVLTDLLVGVLIGIAVSMGFILDSNMRRPLRKIVEKHLGGDVTRIELANQVSFLNRAVLARALHEVPRGGHVMLDATSTNYIDPDVLDLIREFKDKTAPVRGVCVSLNGFQARYQLVDQTQYVDYSTRELQSALTPEQVLQILKDGHERFRTGQRLTRDLGRQVNATALGQHPLAVVLSCIDSRTPTELIFDLGVGDTFSVRIAGNVTSRKVLGSVEYACAVAGAKLIVVMGHTRCGAVTAAVDLAGAAESAAQATGCQHLGPIIGEIQESLDGAAEGLKQMTAPERQAFIDSVARRNVAHAIDRMLAESQTLAALVHAGKIAVIGVMYDVTTGNLEFQTESWSDPVESATQAS